MSADYVCQNIMSLGVCFKQISAR